MTAPGSPLVTAAWLSEHLGDADVRVVDTRWYLDGRSGRDAWRAGHVPGAVWLDVDTDLSGPKGPGRPGRHPLPTAEAFAEVRARAGIGDATRVVAYDDDGGSRAARLWWLLGHFGHPGGAHVLDGGLAAWTAAGGALETGEATVGRASVTVRAGTRPLASKQEMLALAQRGAVLLDARASERYQGKSEPVDARAGHIPGARSAPYASNLVAPGGAFRGPAELSARYRALGVSETAKVVAYCGSGVTACHTLLALTLAGFPDGVLYEGSWSEYAGDPDLPAATGEDV